MAAKMSSSLILGSTAEPAPREQRHGLPELAGLLQVVREDVEKEFRVRVGVDMSMCVGVEELSEGRCVDEVAVLLLIKQAER